MSFRIAGALFAIPLAVVPPARAGADPRATDPAPAAAPAAQPAGAEPIPREQVLRLSPEMEAFLAQHVAGGTANLRLQSLMDALFERGKLGVSYANAPTTTAARTFELRSGNCLSFTLMFAALARRVGLEVRFREVGEVLSWDQRGGVLLNSKHLYTEVLVDRGVIAVDFIPGADKRYRVVRDVDDARVLAHFYSNLGAESLAAGEPRRALAHLEEAIAIDPTFGWAWSNLGVVYRQLGRPAEAEQAYLEAWRLDRADATPLSNLASLYAGQGAERKAARLGRRVAAHRQRNPFYHYRLAQVASAEGRTQEAIGHLKRAVRRAPDDPRLWSRLADLYRAAGAPSKAERSLEKALRHCTDPEAKERLERRLAQWRSGGRTAAGGDGNGTPGPAPDRPLDPAHWISVQNLGSIEPGRGGSGCLGSWLMY
jgi:Flp pilus assembly protein TadD